MIHYIIMTVLSNRSIMYSGIAYDIDPNSIIGSDRWSYALYISHESHPVDYDNIHKNAHGKSSICYMKDVCEIEYHDDLRLLELYLRELLVTNIPIEYTYIIKRVEDGNIKLYCDTISEVITNKEKFIDYMLMVMT